MSETQESMESEILDEVKKQEDNDKQLSPRGVLEILVTGPDSDNNSINSSSSSSSSSSRSSSTNLSSKTDKSLVKRSLSHQNHGHNWRNLFENIKRKSMRRFYSFPLVSSSGENGAKSLRERLNSRDRDEIDDGDDVAPKPTWRTFSCEELAAATDNFSADNLIGKGGHAEVFKGCLSDGEIVAVKRITKKDKNEENRVGNFLSELGIIAHINHPNAAKLIGFGTDGGLHLVLEFSPIGSLASVLHGQSECLSWDIRLKVALGVSEGLHYLHCKCQRRIIHRDITASNILLTETYEPQISDFGLAKWLPDKWIHHVVYPIEGTFGYMAPEYFMHGIVNEKTDVFAFGVLLLELITGCRAVDSCRQSLVMWAKPLLEKNSVKDIADPRLEGSYDVTEMKRAMWTALACIHYLPTLRPNMYRVVQLLRGEEEGEIELREKCGGGRTVLLEACDMDEYSSSTYLNDLDRHKQLAME